MILRDFSGGLNLRDNPADLDPSETPAALNWTLDERGALRVRNGCLNVSSLPGVSGKAAFIFYSAALDQWLCARETAGAPNTLRLHTRPADFSGVWTDRGALNSVVTAKVGFCDFPGATPKVVIASDLNTGATKGVFTWDGAAFTNVSATISGYAVCLWQNRAWVAGYPTSDANGNPTRLFGSKVADPATWAAPDGLTVDVRDVDARKLTALAVAGGALHVFKRSSAHRLSDSSSGAYQTVDATAGCIGPYALASDLGRLVTWGYDALYEWDGIGPGRRAGERCRSLFATDTATISSTPGSSATADSAICAGQLVDRVLYAYPTVASGNNNGLIEYDPQHGWLMKHTLARTEEISSFARKGADLYAAVRDRDVIYKVMSETTLGTDDGTAVASISYKTPWLFPAEGKLARLTRMQVEGRLQRTVPSTLTLKVARDDVTAISYDLTTDLVSIADLAPSIFRGLGHGRMFQFEFVATVSTGAISACRIASLALDLVSLER